MGHSRIKMELIKKQTTRMNTFRKRKQSLLKKISEFSILCGVEACLILYGPRQKDEHVINLEAIFPSNPDDVKRIINKYKKTDQARRCYHVSDYFAEKKKKIDAEILKLHKQIYEANFPLWDVRLDVFLEDQLRVLIAQLDKKLEVADRKLVSFQENHVLMDEFASRMLYSSQIMENYMNRSNSIRNFDNLYDQLPVRCLFPGQTSYMIQSNSNLLFFSDYQTTILGRKLMERNNNTNSLANLQLQLFSDQKPLDVQLPMHFQQMQASPGTSRNPNLAEDLMMKMSKDQNIGNQNGVRPLNNMPSFSRLSDANPSSWIWDNVIFNNSEASSTSNAESIVQTNLSSFSGQEDKFNSNVGTGKLE